MSSAIEKEISSIIGIGFYETEDGVIADAVGALLEKKLEMRRETGESTMKIVVTSKYVIHVK